MNKVDLHNENEVFSALKNGDESALSYFLKLYFAGLCMFAERKVGSKSVAEDIVAEAFIKLWSKRSDFDSVSAMKSFLYIIIRNACFNFIKKQRVHNFHNIQFAYLQNNADDHLEIIRAEVLTAVFNAIQTLPDKCQQIFRMSFLEGVNNKQIADALSLSVQTVKNQKVRAIKLLQLQLKDSKHLLHMVACGIVFLT